MQTKVDTNYKDFIRSKYMHNIIFQVLSNNLNNLNRKTTKLVEKEPEQFENFQTLPLDALRSSKTISAAPRSASLPCSDNRRCLASSCSWDPTKQITIK